jgi:hypothetical protein
MLWISTETMKLQKIKWRFVDRHVRIVPADEGGKVLEEPAIDLLNETADEGLALAKPIVSWLTARDPSVTVRGISCDFATETVIISYTAAEGVAARKPIALKLRAPESAELVSHAKAVSSRLAELAEAVFAQRVSKRKLPNMPK